MAGVIKLSAGETTCVARGMRAARAAAIAFKATSGLANEPTAPACFGRHTGRRWRGGGSVSRRFFESCQVHIRDGHSEVWPARIRRRARINRREPHPRREITCCKNPSVRISDELQAAQITCCSVLPPPVRLLRRDRANTDASRASKQ